MWMAYYRNNYLSIAQTTYWQNALFTLFTMPPRALSCLWCGWWHCACWTQDGATSDDCVLPSHSHSVVDILPHLTLDGLLTPSWKSLYDFDSICSSDSTNWVSNVQFAAHLINVLTLWEGAALPLDSNWFESRCRRLVIQYRVAVRSVQFSPGLRLNLFLSLSLSPFFLFFSLALLSVLFIIC